MRPPPQFSALNPHFGIFFSAVYDGRGEPSPCRTPQPNFSSLTASPPLAAWSVKGKLRFQTNITPIHG